MFARPHVGAEPGLSYPRDESPLGLFDLVGSMSEWILDPAVDGTLYRTRGGSWAHGDPELFKVFGGGAFAPELAADFVGFRMIARLPEEAR